MAVTVSYLLQKIKNLDLTGGPQTDGPFVIGLSSGGFAAAGNQSGQTDIDFFNSAGTDIGGSLNNAGSFAVMAQLTNSNIVFANAVSDPFGSTLQYKIVNTSGAVVLDATPTGDGSAGGHDLAALAGGGFVLTSNDVDTLPLLSSSTYEIDVRIYNNSGVLQTGFVAATGSTFSGAFGTAVTGSAVAALTDGGFVVVWEEDNLPVPPGTATQLGKYAVYNANGSVRFAAADLGGTAPDGITVIGQADGGFAVAYIDGRWDTDTEITLEQFNAAGTRIRTTRITDEPVTDVPDLSPQLTQLSNGFLAIGYTQDYGSDKDTTVAIIDPATGLVRATIGVLAGEDLFDSVVSPTLAGFSNGQIAVFHTNLTDGDIDGEHLQVVRTSTGDSANDMISGDSLADSIVGGGGNDTLSGGAGNDTLAGGAGDDLYSLVETGDTVIEAVGEGIDTVTTAVSLTLAVNVENLQLLTVGNVNGTGNAFEQRAYRWQWSKQFEWWGGRRHAERSTEHRHAEWWHRQRHRGLQRRDRSGVSGVVEFSGQQ